MNYRACSQVITLKTSSEYLQRILVRVFWICKPYCILIRKIIFLSYELSSFFL